MNTSKIVFIFIFYLINNITIKNTNIEEKKHMQLELY